MKKKIQFKNCSLIIFSWNFKNEKIHKYMHVYLRQHLDGCPGFSCFGQIRHVYTYRWANNLYSACSNHVIKISVGVSNSIKTFKKYNATLLWHYSWITTCNLVATLGNKTVQIFPKSNKMKVLWIVWRANMALEEVRRHILRTWSNESGWNCM